VRDDPHNSVAVDDRDVMEIDRLEELIDLRDRLSEIRGQRLAGHDIGDQWSVLHT